MAARAQVAMTRALGENGLSGVEYHLLLVTSAVGEARIRQVELAQELDVPEGRISVVARQLVERGLVDAVRSDPDRRYVRLRLQADGRRLMEAELIESRRRSASFMSSMRGCRAAVPDAGHWLAPRPGELGYGEWSVEQVEAGRCPCRWGVPPHRPP